MPHLAFMDVAAGLSGCVGGIGQRCIARFFRFCPHFRRAVYRTFRHCGAGLYGAAQAGSRFTNRHRFESLSVRLAAADSSALSFGCEAGGIFPRAMRCSKLCLPHMPCACSRAVKRKCWRGNGRMLWRYAATARWCGTGKTQGFQAQLATCCQHYRREDGEFCSGCPKTRP